MDYYCGEIFNKKNLYFKDCILDTRLNGHPVVVLFDTNVVGKVFFLKMTSDFSCYARYPGRYKIIKNTAKNGLDRPTLICLDQVYTSDNESVIPRGELTEKQYKELIQEMYEYNTKIGNSETEYLNALEVLGDIETYIKNISYK